MRDVTLDAEDEKRLRGFQLLSAKPLLVVINVDEGALGGTILDDLGLSDDRPQRRSVLVSAPIEDEIARLDDEEQREFLADLGLDTPSLDRVLQASYDLLGLISFFTVGEDEVRAWTIRRGTVARDAAGAIHSDIRRGFIRAEVVHWDDLLAQGTWSGVPRPGNSPPRGEGVRDVGWRRDELPLQRLIGINRARSASSSRSPG